MKIHLPTKHRVAWRGLTLPLLLLWTVASLGKDKSTKLDSARVTVSVEDSPVENVLASIGTKTGLKIHFDRSSVDHSRRVSINLKDAPVNSLLNEISEQTGLQIAVIKDRVIVEGRAERADIRGVVKDSKGVALPGVSVTVKGTRNGTVTNARGEFSLVARQGEVLVFSFVGFERKEVAVGSATVINVILNESENALKEVVVTSFGIQRQQKSLGYATTTVTSKQLTQAGNTNFASALYGKAAGVRITTAPGGASSAVNVQIRGINSLNYNTQPLFVIDGVIMRNAGEAGSKGLNNNGFWDDQYIRGNGILDINPNDIESLTVLKGASATALYGSDATNGAIVITTKKGSKARGLGVDVNYNGSVENVAFTPKFQNIYGPGYDRETNLSVGATAEGWIPDTESPSGFRPNFRSYANFGPKMEGQQVRWWDGSIRSYVPQPDNYKDIFRQGLSSSVNVALSNQTDKVNYRFSVNRLDYNGIQRKSNQEKNTFNLNSTFKLSNKVSTDVVASYVNTLTHNRPYQMNRIASSYDGFFSRAEDVNLVREKSITSEGYKWVPYNQTARNPDEAFVFNVRPELYNYFWSTLRNTLDETENRLISSVTLNWDVIKNVKFRGRIGNDYTSRGTSNRQYNEYPVAFNSTTSTGNYSVTKGNYSIVYGDALLSYNNKAGSDLNYGISGGFTSRKEEYRDQSSGTNGGLVSENWFSLNNSFGVLQTSASTAELIKYGFLGILNLSYKDYLFLEGTARQEYASSLPVGNNSYFYPSVNASFVFSDAFRMPSFYSYGKIRASYGVVGNAPPQYEAAIAYSQKSLQTTNGSVPQLTAGSSWGNLNLKPEMKHEIEFGLESRFFNSRFGFDASYYSNWTKDVILRLNIARSNGADNQLVNVGELRNKGFELALNGTPMVGQFRWETRLNFAFNVAKVQSLAPGVNQLVFYDAEQSALRITADEGEKLGNIYIYDRLKDEQGNYVIDDNGYYVFDPSKYVKAGNILPKVVGGFSNSFSYKGFNLDFLLDYRLGGQIVSTPMKYAIGSGFYESTLKYRDEAHGGLTYTEGGVTYHDGVLLDGVNQTTGQKNSVIIPAAAYYFNSYQWGAGSLNGKDAAVFDNSYIKMREISLGYTLPSRVSSRLRLSNVRFSLIGRNLFYLWRTLENLDPEAPIGSQWYRQGIDEGSTAATRTFGIALNASF